MIVLNSILIIMATLEMSMDNNAILWAIVFLIATFENLYLIYREDKHE